MIRCEQCEKLLDSDFVEFEYYNNQELCIDCYNEMRGDEEPNYDFISLDEQHKLNYEKFKNS